MLTADGRLADIGTDAELTQRCELYRILITGPGDGVEGVDAGDLATALSAPEARAARPHGRRPGRAGQWSRGTAKHALVRDHW